MANYGNASTVAALVPRYANSSIAFDNSTPTRPNLSMVSLWLVQLSTMTDAILARHGFTVPITDTSITPMLDNFVEQECAALVEGVNGSGRFGPTAQGRGTPPSRYALLLQDVESFIEAVAPGIEALGATRTSPLESIGYRGTDNAGNDIFPIFQRTAFENSFTDWDST